MSTDDFKDTVKITDSWSAKHVHEGSLYGCIVKAENRSNKSFFAYTPYKFLCELPKSEWIDIDKVHACCDAGDDGEFACGIKPVNPLSHLKQFDVTIRPSKPDARGIPDLMNHLESSKFGTKQVCSRILEYYMTPSLQSQIQQLIPRIKVSLEQSQSSDFKAAVAQLLLDIDPSSNRIDLQRLILLGVGYQLDTSSYNALVGVISTTKKSEDTLKILIGLLQQVKSDEKSLEVLANAIYQYKDQIKPYLSRIYSILTENNDNKNAKHYWNQLGCEALGKPKDTRKILWEVGENKTATTCPSEKSLLPSMTLQLRKTFN